MPGFTRRFLTLPSVEKILEIEGLVTIDGAPPEPATGVGTGNVLLIGEFEDGLFANEQDAKGGVEVFNAPDYETKFGSFGYKYGSLIANNPCARQSNGEFWNGNGWIKSFGLKCTRLVIGRVDTSVGQVVFEQRASLDSKVGNFALAAGDIISITTDTGAANSAGLAATTATVTGSGAAFSSIVSGDAIKIKIDNQAEVTITFSSTDITQAAVIARINDSLGFVCASASTTQIKLDAIIKGTSSQLVLSNVTTGALAKLGLTAGTTAGTGNVANVNNVTAQELVTFISASAPLTAINASAVLTSDNRVRVINTTAGAAKTLEITGNGIGLKCGFALNTEVSTVNTEAYSIPAGTRVKTAGGAEVVTMQTVDVEVGNTDVIPAKVRHATDDGLQALISANAANVLVDSVNGSHLVVNNPVAISASLNEEQLDNRYIDALNASLNQSGPSSECDYLLIARRSDTVIREGKKNAVASFENGMAPRKFVNGDPLGTSTSEILNNVKQFSSDRLFYAGKGLKVRIPAIAERGLDGGKGFTKDGFITVRPDTAITTLCAVLAPEENPAQETELLSVYTDVDAGNEVLTIENYKAFKAGGVIVPKLSQAKKMILQSGITSSLESGRKTIARRRMADYIQYSIERLINREIKKLSTQSRRDSIRATVEQFLSGLKSVNNPSAQRIADYKIDDSVGAGNTAENLALGLYYLRIQVKTLSSLDNIIFNTEIGESVKITEA